MKTNNGAMVETVIPATFYRIVTATKSETRGIYESTDGTAATALDVMARHHNFESYAAARRGRLAPFEAELVVDLVNGATASVVADTTRECVVLACGDVVYP